MIDINFVTGIHPPRLPKFARKARLTHRFAVIEHTTFAVGDARQVDSYLLDALIDFATGYDPGAEIFVVDAWNEIGRKERRLADLAGEWKKDLGTVRRMPAAVLSRKRGKLRLCLLTEGWFGPDAPWPYTNSFTYSLLSDHNIGEDVLAFLRGHADAFRWNLSTQIVRNEDTPSTIRKRTRENTEVPKRSLSDLWAMLFFAALLIVAMAAMGPSVHTARQAVGYGILVAVFAGFAAMFALWALRDIDVALSWDGIRKGQGRHVRFIAWDEAKLQLGERKVIARSGTRTISVRSDSFDGPKFWAFFWVIRQESVDRGLRQFDEGEALRTKPYTLGESDLKNFDRYLGAGSGTLHAILQTTALPFIMGLMLTFGYWIKPQRHSLPHMLQNPLVYFALAGLCTMLFCGAWYFAFWLTMPKRKAVALKECTTSLGAVGLVTATADIRDLDFWHEIRWIVQSPTVILFFTRRGSATIVPKRIFASPAEAADFLKQAIALKRAYMNSYLG